MSAGSLQPGVSIKPKTTPETIKTLLKYLYGLECEEIRELNGYDDRNFYIKTGKTIEKNPNIPGICEQGYVLKVINSLDSKKPDFVQAQNQLLLHLRENGISAPKPVRDKSGNYFSVQDFESGSHIVRLLEFINGVTLHQVQSSNELFYQCGEFLARLDDTLKSFHHGVYDSYSSVWLMSSVPKVKDFLFAVPDENRQKLVLEVVEEFSARVLGLASGLEKGLIHGDFNEQNILVSGGSGKREKFNVEAVLDFGDCSVGFYLYEISIAMTYMILEGRNLDAGGHFLGGYNSVRKVPQEEINLLKICIAARLCQSLVLGAYSSLQDPGNSYILSTSKFGWSLLEEIWAQPEEELLQRWRTVAGNGHGGPLQDLTDGGLGMSLQAIPAGFFVPNQTHCRILYFEPAFPHGALHFRARKYFLDGNF